MFLEDIDDDVTPSRDSYMNVPNDQDSKKTVQKLYVPDMLDKIEDGFPAKSKDMEAEVIIQSNFLSS